MFFSTIAMAECPSFISGDIWLPDSQSPVNITSGSCTYTVREAHPIGTPTDGTAKTLYRGYWILSEDGRIVNPDCPYGDPGQYNVWTCPHPTCPDGYRAPFGDVAQCPKGETPPEPAPIQTMAEDMKDIANLTASLDYNMKRLVQASYQAHSSAELARQVQQVATRNQNVFFEQLQRDQTYQEYLTRNSLQQLELAINAFSQLGFKLNSGEIERRLDYDTIATVSAINNLAASINGGGSGGGGGTGECPNGIDKLTGECLGGGGSGGGTGTGDFDDTGIIGAIESLTAPDGLFDKLSKAVTEFFDGEESGLSTIGNSSLTETAQNPLKDPQIYNVSSMLDHGTKSGSCPAPIGFTALGQNLQFDMSPICPWANIVGSLIMVIASIVSFRIVVSGVA